MGMDGVELVMDVERHFGISLRPSEFNQVERVRDMVAIIENRLQALQQPDLSLRAFNLLQNLVREVVGDPDFSILPGEQVKDRLTPHQRRALWKQFRDKLELTPALLQLPWFLGKLVQGAYLRLVLLTLWLSFTVTAHYFLIGLVGIPIIALATNPVIELFRQIPPPGWQTFAEITAKLIGLIALTKQTHLRTADEILAELRQIIVDVIGCKPELVTMDARFVETLGLN
jgi:acyl carrier protein